MKSAFDMASSAHDRRDGASAASYAADGHRYKAESQGYVAERRRLVDEIRAARAQLDACKPAFQRAKDEFGAAKRAFDSAKADHERAQAEFKRAKADFDSCSKAFKARLDKVKATNRKRRDDKKSIAAKAGVPHQYRDNVWVSTDSDGNTNIYFGGVGKPNGPGHGHYVMDRSGTVTYRRDPFDPHGAQNFTDGRTDPHDPKQFSDRWEIQSDSPEAKVLVHGGFTKDESRTDYHDRTDIRIVDKTADGQPERIHLSIDGDGKEQHW